MSEAATHNITLRGTPVELGMQVATSLLNQPLDFAATQLTPEELDAFCCSLISATGGLVARKIGVRQAALMLSTLADVAIAEADSREGPTQ